MIDELALSLLEMVCITCNTMNGIEHQMVLSDYMEDHGYPNRFKNIKVFAHLLKKYIFAENEVRALHRLISGAAVEESLSEINIFNRVDIIKLAIYILEELGEEVDSVVGSLVAFVFDRSLNTAYDYLCGKVGWPYRKVNQRLEELNVLLKTLGG
jgi:hypothetical protein